MRIELRRLKELIYADSKIIQTVLLEKPVNESDLRLAGEDPPKKHKGAGTTVEEQQIDIMVYKLYGLTEDEIAVVEGK